MDRHLIYVVYVSSLEVWSQTKIDFPYRADHPAPPSVRLRIYPVIVRIFLFVSFLFLCLSCVLQLDSVPFSTCDRCIAASSNHTCTRYLTYIYCLYINFLAEPVLRPVPSRLYFIEPIPPSP